MAQRSLVAMWCAINMGLRHAMRLTRSCSLRRQETVVVEMLRPERLVISLKVAYRLVRARWTNFLSSCGVVFLGLAGRGVHVLKVSILWSLRTHDTVN